MLFRSAVRAERSCLAALAGGCLAPIGAWARMVDGGRLELGCCILEDREDRVHRIAAAGSIDQRSETPEALGRSVAAKLGQLGAGAMLETMRKLSGNEGPGAGDC